MPTQDLRMKRDFQTPFEELNPSPSTDRGKRLCDSETIENGLLTLQDSLGIGKSGKLDKETVFLLNSDRCGNTDVNNLEQYYSTTSENSSPSSGDSNLKSTSNSLSTTDVKSTSGDDSPDRGHTYPHNNGVTNSHDDLVDHTTYTSTNEVSKSPTIPHYRLKRDINSLFYPVDEFVHASNFRRLDQYEDIRNSLLGDEVAMKLLHKRLRKQYYRRKRSAPMLENSVVLDSNGNAVAKFKQYENRPITWRLIAAGYSKRFPIMNQIAMLELAFRMWSEVAPLRFKRQDHGHIDDVDVHIIFGQS